MDDLDTLLAEGKITASEYAKQLIERQNSYSLQSEALTTGAQMASRFQENLGTDPSLAPQSGTEYQMSMTPEEMETYTSRGITPSTYRDYEDDRAEAQSIADKWGNGMVKVIGKSATAAIGGVGMLGSALYQVGAQFEDIWGGDNTSFHEIYDNDFYRALDNANKGMDEALPHYITREEENQSVLASLGTHNFWSNDFLQGAAFVVGAIASEGLIGIGAEATGIRNLTKLLNGVNKATKAEKLAAGSTSLFSKSAALQTGMEAATIARQMVTGAGYESAVEAMSFADDAKREWIEEYKSSHIDEKGNPLEPSDQELAAAMKEIYSVGNSVFGMNLIVTGLTQAKTLPGVFAPKLGKILGTSSAPEKKLFDEMVDVSTLSTKQLTRAAKRTGKSIDELKAAGKKIAKEDAYSGLEKFAVRSARGLEGAVFEGGQEGLQKAISYGAMDYLNDRFDPAQAENVIESGIGGLTKAFGNNAESWKEIFIGAVLGSTGGPGGKGVAWQGGIVEAFRNPSKSPEFQRILGLANKYATNDQGILNNYLKHFVLSTNVQGKKDKAVDKGDIYDYKSEEAKEFFDYLNFMGKMDRLSEVEDKHLEEMNKLTKAEFSEKYGYKNLSSSDFTKRKAELNANIKRQVEDTTEARNTASSIYRGGDADVLDGIAYTIFKHKNIDHREGTLATEISELTGIIDPRSLVEISRDNQRLKLKDGWLTTYRDTVEELKQDRDALQTALEANKAFDKTEQITQLEDKIKNKEAELKKLLRREHSKRKKLKKSPIEVGDYELDFAEFEQKVNKQADFLNKIQKHYTIDGFNKEEISKKLADLKTLSKDRERYIGDFNRLLTLDGLGELESQIDKLRKAYIDEELDVQANAIMEIERLKNPAMQVYKAQELIFKMRGNNLGFDPNEASNTSEKIEALNTVINNLPAGPGQDMFRAAMKQVLAKLNSNNVDDIEPYLNNIYAALFNDEANNTPEGKNTLTAVRLAFDEIVAYFKAPKSLAAITSLNRFFKVYAPDGLGIDAYLANTFTHPSDFKVIIEEIDKDDPYVKKVEESNRILPLKNPNKEQILTPFVGLESLIKRNGKYYSIKLTHKTQFVGFILDPNRFKFKNIDTGAYEDFNPKSLAHLRLINPTFVNKGVITDEGKEFINGYVKGREMFKMFEDAIDTVIFFS